MKENLQEELKGEQIWKTCAALNMPANLENSAVATRLEKVSFIPIPKKGNAKTAQITVQLHSSQW